MVLHNPNNWHWVNRDCTVWAKEWFTEKLVGTEAEDKGNTVKIDKLVSSEGDVDISQRKGKLITIFDVKIILEYSGKAADGTEVTGKITIPEVAHDTEEDEYVFDIENNADSNAKQPVRDLVRSKIVPQLRKKLQVFAGELLATHGHDIQHTADNAPVAYAPPTTVTSSSSKQTTAKPSGSAAPVPVVKGAVVNTVTLKEDYEFQTSADQLYLCFTDARRIAAFTRATPRVFEAKEGGKFDMFTGNVQGEFIKLEQNKFIAQKWRLNTWPADHYSTMKILLDQATFSTTIRLVWEDVPIGQEQVSKENFENFYIKSIKSTFGWAPFFDGIGKKGFWVGFGFLWSTPIFIAGLVYYLSPK